MLSDAGGVGTRRCVSDIQQLATLQQESDGHRDTKKLQRIEYHVSSGDILFCRYVI